MIRGLYPLSAISRNKNISDPGGFTLLEVLVALLLMVILAGALYGTYFAVVKSRDMATAGLEPLRDVRATLDLLRREIDSAFYNKNNKQLHFVVEDRDTFGMPSSTLDFTAIATPLAGSAPSSDLIEVRYKPVEKDGKLLLTREETDAYLEVKPSPYPQIEEIQGFLVECHDGNTWVKSWDTRLNNGLPQAVRITLTIREGDRTSSFSIIAAPRMRAT
jgi:general secretion pathway protein J